MLIRHRSQQPSPAVSSQTQCQAAGGGQCAAAEGDGEWMCVFNRGVNEPLRCFTVAREDPNRDIFLLKAPTFTMKHLLRHYAKLTFKHGK